MEGVCRQLQYPVKDAQLKSNPKVLFLADRKSPRSSIPVSLHFSINSLDF